MFIHFGLSNIAISRELEDAAGESFYFVGLDNEHGTPNGVRDLFGPAANIALERSARSLFVHWL